MNLSFGAIGKWFRQAMPVGAGLACVVWAPFSSLAVSPETWKVTSYEEFAAGESERVAILHPGEIQLSPSFSLYSKVGESAIWSVTVSPDGGTLYLGTGNRARIYSVTTTVENATSESKLFADLDGNVVQAMAIGQDGYLYAGVSPGGVVYKISSDGATTLVGECGQPYIWAMEFDENGDLLLATGDNGLIVRLKMDGTTETLLETGEKHILSMVKGGEGKLYFGTAPNGWVSVLDSNKDFRVLYDSSLDEVKAIALDSQGNVFAGIVPTIKIAPKTDNPQAAAASTSASPSKNDKESELVKVSPSGLALSLLKTDNAAINTLHSGDQGVLIGTGDKGILYRLGYRNQADLVLQFPPTDILSIIPRREGGVWMTSANPAHLYALPMGTQEGGLFAAKPLDAGVPAQWGALSFIAQIPQGATFDIQTRSGNTAEPDDHWSDWSDPLAEPGQVTSPAGRFLQWRARFGGNPEGVTAILKEVEIVYQKLNLPPKIESVKTGEDTSSSSSSSTTAAKTNGAKPSSTSSGSSTKKDSPKTSLDLSWQASDPNGDGLIYDLTYRRMDEKLWKEIEKDIDSTKQTWDYSNLPDGEYELRLVASDRTANPKDQVQEDEWITETIRVDSTAPVFGEWTAPKVDGKSFTVSIQVRDALSRLVEASTVIDGQEEEAEAVLSMDGLLDSVVEDFSLSVEGLEAGEHSLMFRVRDQAGNLGAGSIVFIVP